MCMVLRTLVAALIFITTSANAWAGEPYGKVVFKNAKVEMNLAQLKCVDSKELKKCKKNNKGFKKANKKINKLWGDFLLANREALKKPGKDYTVDQFCSFTSEMGKSKVMDMGKLVLDKHKDNFAYNLKALEFLQTLNEDLSLRFKVKNPEKPVLVKLYYYAF